MTGYVKTTHQRPNSLYPTMAVRDKYNLYLLRIAWVVAVNYASFLIWLSVNCGEKGKKK
jgi:hypothetical protein